MCFPSAGVCSPVQNIPPSWTHAPDEREWKLWEWSGLGLLCPRGLHGSPWISATGAHLVSVVWLGFRWRGVLAAGRHWAAAVIRRPSALVRESTKRHAVCHCDRRRRFDISGHFCWRLSDVSLHLSAVFALARFGSCTPHTLVVLPVNLETTIFLLHSPPPSILPQPFSLPPCGFPNHTTTPLKDEPWQIYRRRLSIGRQRDSRDLKPPSHWPGADRLIYDRAVIWCLLPLKWVTALRLIGHRNGVGLRS